MNEIYNGYRSILVSTYANERTRLFQLKIDYIGARDGTSIVIAKDAAQEQIKVIDERISEIDLFLKESLEQDEQ